MTSALLEVVDVSIPRKYAMMVHSDPLLPARFDTSGSQLKSNFPAGSRHIHPRENAHFPCAF
jgi:hypothetical protein